MDKRASTSERDGTRDKRQSRAVALRYDPGKEDAPRILATGSGKIADDIIALAQEHAIPIHDDPLLVEALAALDIDTLIPPELYQVVAEVLAYIVRVRERVNQPHPPSKADR